MMRDGGLCRIKHYDRIVSRSARVAERPDVSSISHLAKTRLLSDTVCRYFPRRNLSIGRTEARMAITNDGEYLSCDWIEGGLAFNRRSLHSCLIVHHDTGL